MTFFGVMTRHGSGQSRLIPDASRMREGFEFTSKLRTLATDLSGTVWIPVLQKVAIRHGKLLSVPEM